MRNSNDSNFKLGLILGRVRFPLRRMSSWLFCLLLILQNSQALHFEPQIENHTIHHEPYIVNPEKARIWPSGWDTSGRSTQIHSRRSKLCARNRVTFAVEREALIKYFPQNTLNVNCFHSQSTEDVLFYRHFGHSLLSPESRGQKRYFIEMGGLDGVRYSNTYAIESLFGWYGILIEPGPGFYRRLLKNRPNVIAFNEIVCDKGEVEFFTGGSVGGARELFDSKFIQRWYLEHQPKTIKLTCVSLTSLLSLVQERSGVSCYDFFSLDVEGAELSVVSTLDFDRFHFRVIVIEEAGYNRTREEAVAAIVMSHGYEKYNMPEDEKNGWYVMNDKSNGCSL